jgi:hypothetical protein
MRAIVGCVEEALAASLEKVEGLFCYLAHDKLKDIKSEVLSILQKAKSDLRGTVKSANALHRRAVDAAKSNVLDESKRLNDQIYLLGGRREPLDRTKTFTDAKHIFLHLGQIFRTLSTGALYVERNNVLGNLELAYRLFGPDIPLRHSESTTIHGFIHPWYSSNSESYCRKYKLPTPHICAYCGKELAQSRAVGAHAMIRQKGCVYVIIVPVHNKCNHHQNEKQFPNFNIQVQGVLLMKIKKNAIAYAADTFIQVKKKDRAAGGKISHFYSALITSNSITFNGRTKRGIDTRFSSKDMDGFLAAMVCSMMNLSELPMQVTELDSDRLITISESGKIISRK